MSQRERIVIIGAGHNGLVTAYYLAKAGLAPLVLERRNIAGGIAVTEELHAGFRCPTLAHTTGPLHPMVIRDLRLETHGLKPINTPVRVCALDRDGGAVVVYEDAARTAQGLDKLSPKDSKRYKEFRQSFANIGRVIAPLLALTPPDIKNPSTEDMWHFGKLGLKFRGLSKKDAFRLLRCVPMPVADLVSEWFETELLRAAIAARGIYGTFAGPRSAGTSAALILQAALDGHAVAPAGFVQGGMGAVTEAVVNAASRAGAEVRTNAEVKTVVVKDGKAAGVVLANGEGIPARAVVSNADPQNTFLNLFDPIDLDPEFLHKVRNYRSMGTVAKVNLALSGLPAFSTTELSGRIHIGPDLDYLERAFDAAKYGDFSPQPYMDITIPSLTDPSLAPKGAHVMSVYVQYAPYRLKTGDWKSRREEFGDTVLKTLSEYAPNIHELVLARRILTPIDLEQQFGLTGGHILHGEPALDQLFTFRPILGWAQYRTPIRGLYLCGSGTHPGGGITGAPGLNASREILKDLRGKRWGE